MPRHEESTDPAFATLPEVVFVDGEPEPVWTPDRSDRLGHSTYSAGWVTKQLAASVDRDTALERRVDALLLDVQNLQALAKVQQETINDLTEALDRHLRKAAA